MSDPTLTADQLAKLRQHVVYTADGALADTPEAAPRTVEEFRTTAADVQDIVAKHLDAFVRAQQAKMKKSGDEIPDTWIFNDFGEWAIKFYRDADRDGRLDPEERKAGVVPQFLHTTPDNEAQTTINNDPARAADHAPVTLGYSHGCIHITPEDRDMLKLMDAFKPGTVLKVLPYK